MAGLRSALSDGDWITPQRVRNYLRLLFAATVLMIAFGLATSSGGLDALGKPLGTDFISFWSASQLTLKGTARDVYDLTLHRAAETAIFGHETGYAAFFYPPPYLLICWPLALAPYPVALALWIGVTGCFAYATTGTVLARTISPVQRLAFPAVFLTIGHGQNAFLAVGLLALGCHLWDRRPLVAGFVFGVLIFKPQIVALLPLILIFTGRWRVFAAAAASAMALCLIALLVFGADTWQRYFSIAPLAKLALETNSIGNEKMVSLFAAARVLGANLGLAYTLQMLMLVAVIAGLWLALRTGLRPAGIDTALVGLSAALASPFLLDYDLMVLALPIGWLIGEGQIKGFRPFEKSILFAACCLPAFARPLAGHFFLPLAPLVIGALCVVVVRRRQAYVAHAQ